MVGRKVWHQYWDLRITFQKSYLARLNYVMQNPVRHGIVGSADQYPLCSASWFEMKSSPAFFQSVSSCKIDALDVLDDF
jgi:putative transposase